MQMKWSSIGLKYNPFKSITIQGIAGALLTYVVAHINPDALPPAVQTVLIAVSALWAAIGTRNLATAPVVVVSPAVPPVPPSTIPTAPPIGPETF